MAQIILYGLECIVFNNQKQGQLNLIRVYTKMCTSFGAWKRTPKGTICNKKKELLFCGR